MSSSSTTHFSILEQVKKVHTRRLLRDNKIPLDHLLSACLSLTKLAFAKQSEPELMRITMMPGVLVAIGY
jgi:hypothetical protein